MSGGMYLTELNSPDILQILQSKLPYNMQDKWNRLAVKTRRSQGREADFIDFLKIVETETMVANDPMYSREAVSTRIATDIPAKNSSKPMSGVSNFSVELKRDSKDSNNFSVEVKNGKPVICKHCMKEHDLDECPDYRKLEVKERKSFLFKNRLCFGCYKPVSATHKVETCFNKRICQICQEPHPTGLHKETVVASQALSNMATGLGGEKEATVDTCNRVISMCIVPVELFHKSNPNNIITVYVMLDNCSEGC